MPASPHPAEPVEPHAPQRWSARRSAVVAAVAIGLTSTASIAAAATIPTSGASSTRPGGMSTNQRSGSGQLQPGTTVPGNSTGEAPASGKSEQSGQSGQTGQNPPAGRSAPEQNGQATSGAAGGEIPAPPGGAPGTKAG